MRPGQHNNNKRPRGRGRGGKPHHQHNNGGGGGGGGGGGQHFNINRTIDSNGPDIKIRGNAHHIYEKYLQLARDANSSGDRVMAENYLQHAEHYYRMIMAAQAAMPQQQPYQNPQHQGQGGQPHANGDGQNQGNYRPQHQPNGTGPQPSMSGNDGSGAQPDVEMDDAGAEAGRYDNN